jgi:hypothetical protein
MSLTTLLLDLLTDPIEQPALQAGTYPSGSSSLYWNHPDEPLTFRVVQ